MTILCELPTDLLQPLPLPKCPMSHIGTNFLKDLPASQGNPTILVVIDHYLSKACCLIPHSKLPTALETVEALFQNVFWFYGLSEDIVSDRGLQFISQIWKSFCGLLNINVTLISRYHPQCNGQVERLNRDMRHFLRTYCHNNQHESVPSLGRVRTKLLEKAFHGYDSLSVQIGRAHV